MHGPTSQPGSFDYDHSVLVDAGGNILLDVGVIERVVHTPDGPVRERITPMVELSDGRIWDRNGGAVVPGGVCQLCRQQAANRHPVVSQVAGMKVAKYVSHTLAVATYIYRNCVSRYQSGTRNT